jgi:urease gamma subunit
LLRLRLKHEQWISIQISAESVIKGARAYVSHSNMSEWGETLITSPDLAEIDEQSNTALDITFLYVGTQSSGLIIKGMQLNTKERVDSVAEGVEKSVQSGKAFEKIIDMVNESTIKVTEIAVASEEQSSQAGEVMRSVQSIATASEEAAAEETAATLQTLAHSAEELNTSVSVFRVNK